MNHAMRTDPLLAAMFSRRDGLAPSPTPNNPDWMYRTFNQLNGDINADPRMIAPSGINSRMPMVPDYNLNQHVQTEGVMPGYVSSSQPSINPATGLPQFNLADAQAGNRMSGSMMPPGMPPMGGPPMGGAPPGMGGPPGMGAPPGGPPGMPQNNGVPQLPPQVIQMLMQALQQGGGQGGPPGMQQPPQGPPPALPHPGMQQMAAQGQNGDTLVAHMTPGEIAVPPQVQTPQLMQVLRAAFAQMGINPAQFTAGAPQAARNPSTGAPEFSIWSTLLPILGGVAGSFIPIPGVGTAAGAALGGAAGGAAGGLIDHQSPLGVALSAAGGAAGGYMGAPAGGAAEALAPAASNLGADAVTSAAASNALANGAAPGMQASMSAAPNVFSAGAQAAPGVMGNAAAGGAGQAGNLLSRSMPYIKTGLAAGTGAGIGGMLAPPPASDPLDKAGFNKKLGPINPNFNQVRGSGQTSTPNFTGYNPYAAVSGPNPGFSFFPQQ